MITVAIPNSPVFSPSSSRSIYSPESLSLSPAFNFCIQKPLTRMSGLTSCSDSPTLSKRKRPAKLDIPVARFKFKPALVEVEDRWNEVEDDGDGYSVYRKKGKRDVMEDRFKSIVEFNGQHKQIVFINKNLIFVIWDKVSNQEAIDLARPFGVGDDKLEPILAYKKLVELTASRGSIDDATMMIVQLRRFC